MQLKRVLIMFAMVATVAMVGCRTVSSEPPSSPKETQKETSTAVTETEAATEAEDIIEATEPTDMLPEEPYDGFTLVNSPDFEPFKFSHIHLMLEREGIDDINFFRYTKPDSIIVGKIGDIIVGQMQMDDGVVWNVRIEKADDFVNNTGIDISSAEQTLEHEQSVHGMQYIYKNYFVDFSDMDAIDAALEAGEELNLSNARFVKIEFVLNKTKSMLYTFYREGCWFQAGENTLMWDNVKRGPAAIIKSEADYALEALN